MGIAAAAFIWPVATWCAPKVIEPIELPPHCKEQPLCPGALTLCMRSLVSLHHHSVVSFQVPAPDDCQQHIATEGDNLQIRRSSPSGKFCARRFSRKKTGIKI